jgi:hypothetical protein
MTELRNHYQEVQWGRATVSRDRVASAAATGYLSAKQKILKDEGVPPWEMGPISSQKSDPEKFFHRTKRVA